MTHRVLFLSAIGLVLCCVSPTSQAEEDPSTGLKIAPGWELVRAHCLACHSARLITQQRGSEPQWLATIRWMQSEQNLWTLASEVEADIVDYLATNYPPSNKRRRSPIPRQLMPPTEETP